MPSTIRRATPADAIDCGRILHDAFASVADQHNFPHDFPSVAIATEITTALIGHPGFYGLVAERDGRVLGSAFADTRDPITGIGPVSVDPGVQNQTVGRSLMQALLDHATASATAGVRLLQTAYHNRSLCLYTRLGFQVREPISLMQGAPVNARFAGYHVRPATLADVTACNGLCRTVHGVDRGHELTDAIGQGSAIVVEHLGRITGYATGVGFRYHAVARSNAELKALIGAATAFPGPGFLLPTRNHEVFAWCLDNKLRLVMQMTLMTVGLYNEPAGSYLTSILY